MKLKKLTGLCYATDELLGDSTALEAINGQAFAEEFGFKMDDAIINGIGSGQLFIAVENPDLIIPTIASTVPANNAVGIAGATTFQWVFSEAMDPNTITVGNLYLIKDSDGSLVAGTMVYNSGTFVATFTPTVLLTATSKYIAIATIDVADLDGIHIVPINNILIENNGIIIPMS